MNLREASWIAHTKGKYPREFASPRRLKQPIKNDDHIVMLTNAYSPAHACYCSVYSFDDWVRDDKNLLKYHNAIVDCVFIDLDCENHVIAHYEAKLLDLYFNHYGCQPRIYFTGNKGFAVYIDFPEVQLNKQTVKLVLRKYLESIKSVLSLKTIDRACFDSISRISRLPNTINYKSGLYCIPLTREELWNSLSNIKKSAKAISKSPVVVNECNSIPGILLSIQKEILESDLIDTKKPVSEIPVILPINRTEPAHNLKSFCPGIMEIIDGASKGSRDNNLCALICALNLQLTKTGDEIFSIAKKWTQDCNPPIDLQDSQLTNKINYLVVNNYRPCTFAMRTNNKMCKSCPVSKR